MKLKSFILFVLLFMIPLGSGLILKSEVGCFESDRVSRQNLSKLDTLKSELVITLARIQIDSSAPGLKIILQDETTGGSRPLIYDPKTMTARASVDTSHRYTVAIDAPGYTPYRKYIAKVQANQEIGVQLTRANTKTGEKKYVLIVLDKEQRSVVPDADVRVVDEDMKPVNVFMGTGQYVVLLPGEGNFTYEVTASEYQSVRGNVGRSTEELLVIGLVRKKTAVETQTIAFVAQDAFTQKPIAARFWLKGAETSPTATVTTAANPQYGTEVKLRQPYTLKVESDGYANYSAPITLDAPEAEPIKPRVVMMEPLAYEVNFTILDAVTMKPIDPASFQVGEAGKALNLQSVGNSRKVNLAPDKQYDIRVGQPGYELFGRTLTFDKPTEPKDLLKSILLSPVKVETTPAVAAAPAPVPAAAKVDETMFENLKVGEAVRLDNVYFNQSSYILRTESYPQLDKLVKTLQVNAKLKVEIAGHTDNVGDARLNQYLSENRARVISSYLAGKGIVKDRLVPKGYGQTKPVAANDTEENKAQNRRVEFVVLEN